MSGIEVDQAVEGTSSAGRPHSGPELRAMITARQREIEEIAVRCAQAGYERASQLLGEVSAELVHARASIARVEAQ